MRFSLKSSTVEKLATDCLVVTVGHKSSLSPEAKQIDACSGKSLSKIMRSGDFDGTLASTQMLHNVTGVKAKRVLLLGLGERKKLDGKNANKALQAAIKALLRSSSTSAHFALSSVEGVEIEGDWLATRLSQEAQHAAYKYDQTKSKKAAAVKLKSISLSPIAGSRRAAVTAGLKAGSAVGKGMNLARQLGNLPGNICTPTFLAEEAQKLASKNRSLETKVLSERQMQRLGMGSLLSVSAGSAEEAKLIIISHKGASKKSKPHVLVGKGITFDTGGISLKGGGGMDEMKFDMCGAASVIGAMAAVAELMLPINVVAIVAAAENMPSGKATKPGDVVTSMSGKTIEVLNTDAEGRLVLCDALSYAERFDPKSVIDIATLTGAAVATFGSEVTALMSNDEVMAAKLLEYGKACLDPAWELPLLDEYQKLLNSNFADIANIGGPRAGTITAGCFLARFTEKYKWTHLDIAGTAWHSGAAKGATGRPVPLLLEYLRQQKA